MRHRNRKNYWLAFIAIAVMVHLFLFLSWKQSFFSIFGRNISHESTPPAGTSFSPDAIITIPVELMEDRNKAPSQKPKVSEQESSKITRQKQKPGGVSHMPDFATDSIVGSSASPILDSGGAQAISIPPRPLEIAWPDTRDLKQCLGESIALSIKVGIDGRILKIDVANQNHPRECTEAALEAAKKIKFAAGTINGKPAQMWTQIRIDFKPRSQ